MKIGGNKLMHAEGFGFPEMKEDEDYEEDESEE